MKHIIWNSYKINKTQDTVDDFVSIISTKVPSKGTSIEYVGNDITKIVTVVKTVKSVQLTTKIVKSYNHASCKSVNETSPSTYLMWIPKQRKQNVAMIIIKIACLKSSVRHRAKIKEDINIVSFEDKVTLKGRAMLRT